MRAMEPDVVMLDEVFGAVTEADLQAFFARPEMVELEPWEFVLGTSGGRQKTVVASRIGLRSEPALQRFPYPDGALDALGERFPEGERLLDLERERGLASVGAWVDVAGHPILFVPVDLQSTGYDGSFQDELRVLQARTLRDFVAGALEASGTRAAVVIGGDLNLVGSRSPLDALGSGLDGGSDLIPVEAYRLTDRSMTTWRNDDDPFTPGRLDFVLVSGTSLSADRAFVFDASELSDDLLEQLGVNREDQRVTSDHLPLIVDFSLRRSP
jgi:endonuclease/exonuclease/phosphatase family metal-dependent hydrolase